jgi:hypothetical protein
VRPPSCVHGVAEGASDERNLSFTLCAYDDHMKKARTLARMRADLQELEFSAERAGVALACAYSSAAEFEAAVIRAHRGRGLVGDAFIARMRFVVAASATAAALMVLAIVVL